MRAARCRRRGHLHGQHLLWDDLMVGMDQGRRRGRARARPRPRTGARGLPLHSQRDPARPSPAPPTNARSLHSHSLLGQRPEKGLVIRLRHYDAFYAVDYGQEAGSPRVIRTVLCSWSMRGSRQGEGRRPWGLTGLAPHPVHVPSVAQGPKSHSHSPALGHRPALTRRWSLWQSPGGPLTR